MFPQMALVQSFLWPSSYSIICMYDILFIHSSEGEYVGCCCVLAVVNSAAFGVHVSF